MSSENIYTIPYFYIIRHIKSNKLYAGSRYAKFCNPTEFMQPDGYTTSSTKINSIIESQGLESFEILRIDTNCDGLHPYDYETLFLKINDCAGSSNWLNEHNNTGMAFGTEQFNNSVLEIYGVNNISKSPEIKQKKIETSLKNYGVECPLQQSDIIKEKSKQTLLEIYGVDNASKSPEIKQKKIDKAQEKYGVDNPFQADEVKEQIKKTNLEKYGYKNSQQCPEIKEKSKQTRLKNNNGKFKSDEELKKQKETNLEKYGVSCVLQSEEIKEKIKKSNLKKYGVEHNSQSEEIKLKKKNTRVTRNSGSFWSEEELKKQKKTNLEKYGYDNPSKIPFLSIIENRKTYSKNIISGKYPELKQYY